MRIITANVNGVRSAASKGFFKWAMRQRADVICLQETKAQEWQLEDPQFHPKSLHSFYHDAEKKGYSGTALFCKAPPVKVIRGLNVDWIDREGRYLEAQFGNLSVISLYLPSGTTGDIRQEYKYKMMDVFLPHLKKLKASKRSVIVCGDWNIAHTEADIKNWRGNKKNSGFLPEEREWVSEFINSGFVDTFRHFNMEPDNYSWWSYRAGARGKNLGWRIDYHMASDPLKERLTRATILPEAKHSDHCPIVLELEE